MRRRRQTGEESTVRVDLSAGATITLVYRGNLFDLNAEERKLVSDLSSTIQNFRDKLTVAATG